MAPPGEEAVDQTDEGDDAEEGGGDHGCNFQTEPRAHREGVQGVGGPVLLVVGDDDPARCEAFLFLWPAELGAGERGGNTHHAGGDEGLCVHAHGNIGDEHATGDGCEARAHDLVEFGHGEVWYERADEHGGFALADEGGGGGYDGFGAGDAHAPEEEDGEFPDKPLQDVAVVEELDNGDEEDDGGNHANEEPVAGLDLDGLLVDCNVHVVELFLGQEDHALLGEAEELTGQHGDKVKDVVAGLSAEHKERDDELDQHADDDRVPHDYLAVARGGP